jgi:hypothetical protein
MIIPVGCLGAMIAMKDHCTTIRDHEYTPLEIEADWIKKS